MQLWYLCVWMTKTKKAWKSLVGLQEEGEPWRNTEAFRADVCISIAHMFMLESHWKCRQWEIEVWKESRVLCDKFSLQNHFI